MDTKSFFSRGLADCPRFRWRCDIYPFEKIARYPRVTDDREVLYQVSTIDALMQGVFDGVQTFGEIRKKGDFRDRHLPMPLTAR